MKMKVKPGQVWKTPDGELRIIVENSWGSLEAIDLKGTYVSGDPEGDAELGFYSFVAHSYAEYEEQKEEQ